MLPLGICQQIVIAFQLFTCDKLIFLEVLELLNGFLPFSLHICFCRNNQYQTRIHLLSATHSSKALAETHHGIHQQVSTFVLDGCIKSVNGILLVWTWSQRLIIASIMEVLTYAAILHRIELVAAIILRGTIRYIIYSLVNIVRNRILEKLIGKVRQIWELLSRNSATMFFI